MSAACDLNHEVAIVGAAETDKLGVLPQHWRLSLHAEAIRNALADAGLKLSDVDSLLSAQANPNELSEYLGNLPRCIDGTSVGGCSYMSTACLYCWKRYSRCVGPRGLARCRM